MESPRCVAPEWAAEHRDLDVEPREERARLAERSASMSEGGRTTPLEAAGITSNRSGPEAGDGCRGAMRVMQAHRPASRSVARSRPRHADTPDPEKAW